MSAFEQPRRRSCLQCSRAGANDNEDRDGRQPCQPCIQAGRDCVIADEDKHAAAAAWARVPPEAIQQWPEPVQLVPGLEGAIRLQPRRDPRTGRVQAFEPQSMTCRDQSLRMVPQNAKSRLAFPANIELSGETEGSDLFGDPVRFEVDGHLLHSLHEELPYEPVHPALYLNAALRDRAPLHSSRIASSFEPSEVNYGNTSSSAYYRDSEQGSWRCGTVWRRAPEAGGRATAVGWGSFSPLPVDARPKNDKGKERAVDPETPLPMEDGRIRTSVEPLLTTLTTILQLQFASLPDPGRLLLACRSQTALDLMLLDSEPASSAGLPAPLSHYRYPSSALNACPIADVALGGIAPGYGEACSGLVVDVEGALFGFGLGGSAGPTRAGEQPEMFRLRRGRRKKRSEGLARVAWAGIRGLDAVVGLEDEVLLYDLRSPTSSTTLVDGDILKRHPSWDTPGPARITSLLSRSPTHPLSASSSCPTPIHVVCTTRDVLWLDERMPGREVLRWHHGRAGIEGKGSDTTLSLIEVPSLDTSSASEGTVQRVALHSRLHPQIDIFTTELAPAKAPRTLLEPYSICPPPSRRAEGPSEAFERTRAGLSLVACRTDQGDEAGEAALGQEAMQVDLAQDSSSDDEGATAKHGAGRGDRERDRRRLTWRILEVGSRGELESWEACAARDGDVFARSEGEYEAAALPVSGPASGLHPAVGGSVTWQRRKRLDTRALLAALEADQRVLDEPDELRLGGKIGAVNLFASEQVGSGQADVGALTPLELAILARSEAGLSSLPRAPLHLWPQVCALDSSAAEDPATDASAPARISLRPREPPTLFDALMAPCQVTDATVPPAWSLANDILLPRTIEPDEPTLAPNQPQPVDEEPPALHFSYLRPRQGDADSEEEGNRRPPGKRGRGRRRGPRPSLDHVGARLLLAEWHLGADPRSYAWHNPYEGEKNKAVQLEGSQSTQGRKVRKKRDGTSAGVSFDDSSQLFPPSSAFPSAFPPSSPYPASSQTYFPSLLPPSTPARPTSGFEPRLPALSSQDWNQAAATQPAIAVTGPAESPAPTQAPFGAAASQVVPGAFGSRLSVGGHGAKEKEKKKKAKKRVSGF